MDYLDPTLTVSKCVLLQLDHTTKLAKMYRIITCLALCVLVNGQTPAAPVAPVAPVGPVNGPVNPALPPVPGRGFAPGYNNPYYNSPGANVPILSYSNERGPDGSYSFSFATGDGKQAQETGFLKDAFIDNVGNPQGTQVVEGSYSYISPEGIPIQVRYVADENGFRPSGVHIPADGKGVLPVGPLGNPGQGPLGGPLGNFVNPAQAYDPRFNGNNPYNRNPYRPFDPRNPYDGRFNGFNPFRPAPGPAAEEVKKESA